MILATQYLCHVGVDAAKGQKPQHASIPDERGNKKAEFLYVNKMLKLGHTTR